MLAKHGGIYLLAKILPAILSVAMLAILTRYLTTEQYGTYSLTMLTASLFSTVCLSWVVIGVGRFLPDCRDQSEADQLLGTARLIVLLVSAVLLTLFLVLNYLKDLIKHLNI